MTDNFVFWDSEGKIIPSSLYNFFRVQGIGKYYPDEVNWKKTPYQIVRVVDNVVSIVSTNFLISFALDHINKQVEDKRLHENIINSLHRSTSLFSERNLMLLPEIKLDFLSDTKDSAYYFFKNGIVKVTATDITLHDYTDFKQFIWEESIKDHEFCIVDTTVLEKYCEYNQFLTDLTIVKDADHAEKRLRSLKSAIGYLIHRHKDGRTTQAIILMDVYVDGNPNGRSGKTLLARSLEKVRILSLLNGKIYDKNEWFSLSGVELNSDIILFDDANKNFDFESLFNLMTTNLEVRIPRKGHIIIPHEKSPKVIVSTNYAIVGDSDSYRGRKFEFEVSPTYNADYAPYDRYGHMLFDDWSIDQWNFFYNTLFSCVKIYLNNGLIKSQPINIQLTKIINDTCEDFIEYAEDKLGAGKKYIKKEVYNEFNEAYPGNRINIRDITSWMKKWAAYKGYSYNDGHSNDIRYFEFVEKPAKT